MAESPIVNHPEQGLCRDCLSLQKTQTSRRCHACGSPRLIRHKELYRLSLAHVDCDAFYASVEKRDNPDLRDKPLIVGGGKRGVVSTACYLARIHGVRSAMPMFKALEACPDAVVIKPNMEKYARVGREVRQMMRDLTPLVEPISIDEAFLDLSGTERLHKAPPAVVLARFSKRVENEIGRPTRSFRRSRADEIALFYPRPDCANAKARFQVGKIKSRLARDGFLNSIVCR